VNKINFTKNNIINNLSKKTGYPVNLSKKLINDFIDALIQNIKKDTFLLKNIGTFKILKKKERKGRNPKTKEEFLISERKTISFIASKQILDILNGNK